MFHKIALALRDGVFILVTMASQLSFSKILYEFFLTRRPLITSSRVYFCCLKLIVYFFSAAMVDIVDLDQAALVVDMAVDTAVATEEVMVGVTGVDFSNS